jgi:HSP20 family protein
MTVAKPRRSSALMPLLDPFGAIGGIEGRLRRLLIAAPDDTVPTTVGWTPPTEIVETDDELLLTAELPGMTKREIELTLEEGVLTLRGDKLDEYRDAERRYHLFERSYGRFARSFRLPRSVDHENVTAEFNNGVLRVHLPKVPAPASRGRRIEIVET